MIDDFLIALQDGLFDPPRQGKCPMNDLPNELLSYVFQLGVEIEPGDQGSVWQDVNDGRDSFTIRKFEWEGGDDDGASVNSSDSISTGVQYGDTLPFQVLVSHVCRYWRSVALNTPRFWTRLRFSRRRGLAQMKEYISRSNGCPLIIDIDYYVWDVDMTTDQGHSTEDEEKVKVLGLEKLDQILGLLEPTISQWGRFVFWSEDYVYSVFLMSRLDKLPAAPHLESFHVHNILDIAETPLAEAQYPTNYLPFHGQVPNLKEVAIREVPIDWEGALPNFLRGLRVLKLLHQKTDTRPTYAAFAEIINNSPELHALTLFNAGPVLANDIAFDSHAAWGPVPLSLPSLTRLGLKSHELHYATALVRHLDMPNLMHLDLNFDFDADYSYFVQALAKPVRGRGQSLLRTITHLTVVGLSFNSTNANIFLSELISLKSLCVQPLRAEDRFISNALTDPRGVAIGPGSVDPPGIFCPKLEEVALNLD